MATTRKPDWRTGEKADRENIPIYTHVYLLGVDVSVWQRGHNIDGEVDKVRAYGNEIQRVGGERCRRDLAAWARRNLFSGQPTASIEE